MNFPPTESIILLGDQALAARHIRVCRAKADVFARNIMGMETLSKRLIFPNGYAVIEVSAGTRKYTIKAEAGHCHYEFFTSELIEPNYLFTPPYDGDPDPYSVCGKGSYYRLGAGKTGATLVDLCDGCSDAATDPGDLTNPYQKMDCGSTVGLDDMKTQEYWNMLKTQQYLWFDDFKGEKFVIGGHDNAPYSKPKNFLARYNVRTDPLPGGGLGWFLYSIGSQVPKAYVWDNFSPYSTGGFTPGASEKWWGGALVRTDNFELICCVNNANTWKFWETGDWSVLSPPRVLTKVVGLGPTLSHGLQTIQFNSAGTAGVAVLTEYQNAKNDKSGNAVYKATQGTFQGLLYGSGNVDVAYGGSKTLAQDESSFLVEYLMTPYEDGGGDFQVDITTGVQNRWLATGDYILAADYLGADYEFDSVLYTKDSLVIAVYEPYYDSVHGLTVGASPYWPDDGSVYVQSAIKIKIYKDATWNTVRTMVMQDNLFTYPTSAGVFKDPYGNDQHGWATDMIPGDDGTGGYYLALRSDVINAFQLKTLSWVRYRFYQTQPGALSSSRVGSSAIEIWHKNALVKREENIKLPHGSDTFSSGDPAFPRTNYLSLPAAQIEVIQAGAFTVFDPKLRGQIAFHPKGHWATCQALTPVPSAQDDANDFFMVDEIFAAGKPYNHKQLYNDAFGDTRDYGFYNDTDDYRGVFMTAGLFRDA